MLGAMRFVPAVLTVLLLASSPAWAQGITGPARVIDGDTIDVAGQRIRLHGIDAPESKQGCRYGMAEVECGKKATNALRRLIARRPVVCQERDVDRYGRVVAVCFNAEGQDVGAELVHKGWALAYRRFSLDYVRQEQEAKARKAGLWSMDFIEPWEWRRGTRRSRSGLRVDCQVRRPHKLSGREPWPDAPATLTIM